MIQASPSLSRRGLLAWLLAVSAPGWASLARLPELADEWPAAQLRGSGRVDALGLHICDIRLWVADDFSAERFTQCPLALEIEYARALSGRRIAERAADEMQRVASMSSGQRTVWLAAMKEAFPDVAKGERLTGLYRPNRGATYFHDGRPCADIEDPAFAAAFFAIWLSPKTSDPALRKALLGGRS